jgi:hypothetical protein
MTVGMTNTQKIDVDPQILQIQRIFIAGKQPKKPKPDKKNLMVQWHGYSGTVARARAKINFLCVRR